MNPQLNDTLTALALKLGTTAEHLYPLMVEKARMDAYVGLFGFGALALACGAVVYLSYVKRNEWEEVAWLPGIIGTLLCCLFTGVSLGNISDLRYPEVAALQSLISRK